MGSGLGVDYRKLMGEDTEKGYEALKGKLRARLVIRAKNLLIVRLNLDIS